MNEFVKKALSCGFTEAVWMDALDIQCESRLRAYCTPEDCPNYGYNWVCPPGSGSIEECAGKVSRFKNGILLQSVTSLIPPVDNKIYKELSRRHNQKLQNYVSTLGEPTLDILVLTTGGCIFCNTCAYPEPCVKPGMRMNSLSAYGIDVSRLCEKVGLEYSFRPDMVYYTALVLIR